MTIVGQSWLRTKDSGISLHMCLDQNKNLQNQILRDKINMPVKGGIEHSVLFISL